MLSYLIQSFVFFTSMALGPRTAYKATKVAYKGTKATYKGTNFIIKRARMFFSPEYRRRVNIELQTSHDGPPGWRRWLPKRFQSASNDVLPTTEPKFDNHLPLTAKLSRWRRFLSRVTPKSVRSESPVANKPPSRRWARRTFSRSPVLPTVEPQPPVPEPAEPRRINPVPGTSSKSSRSWDRWALNIFRSSTPFLPVAEPKFVVSAFGATVNEPAVYFHQPAIPTEHAAPVTKPPPQSVADPEPDPQTTTVAAQAPSQWVQSTQTFCRRAMEGFFQTNDDASPASPEIPPLPARKKTVEEIDQSPHPVTTNSTLSDVAQPFVPKAYQDLGYSPIVSHDESAHGYWLSPYGPLYKSYGDLQFEDEDTDYADLYKYNTSRIAAPETVVPGITSVADSATSVTASAASAAACATSAPESAWNRTTARIRMSMPRWSRWQPLEPTEEVCEECAEDQPVPEPPKRPEPYSIFKNVSTETRCPTVKESIERGATHLQRNPAPPVPAAPAPAPGCPPGPVLGFALKLRESRDDATTRKAVLASSQRRAPNRAELDIRKPYLKPTRARKDPTEIPKEPVLEPAPNVHAQTPAQDHPAPNGPIRIPMSLLESCMDVAPQEFVNMVARMNTPSPEPESTCEPKKVLQVYPKWMADPLEQLGVIDEARISDSEETSCLHRTPSSSDDGLEPAPTRKPKKVIQICRKWNANPEGISGDETGARSYEDEYRGYEDDHREEGRAGVPQSPPDGREYQWDTSSVYDDYPRDDAAGDGVRALKCT